MDSNAIDHTNMKRLIFIPLLIFSILCNAQFTKSGGTFLKSGNAFISTPAEDLYCDQYDAILAAMGTDPTGDTIDWQNDLVYSLDSAGFFDRTKLLYMPVAASSLSDSYINWAKPGTYNLSTGNAPAFDRVRGWDADGTADYLNSGWIPASDSLLDNHTAGVGVNDMTLAAWSLSNVDGDYCVMGTNMGGTGLELFPNMGDNLYSRINTGELSSLGDIYTAGGTIAFLMATRRGGAEVESYRNGAHLGNHTDASDQLISTYPLYVLRTNYTGGSDYASYFDGVISIVLVMDQVSDAEADAIYDIFHRYMTRIGL